MVRIAFALALVAMAASAACSRGDQRGTSDTTMADSMMDTTHQMMDTTKAMPDTTKRP